MSETQYLGGGMLEIIALTPTKKLIKQTRYIGNHTEITTVKWK